MRASDKVVPKSLARWNIVKKKNYCSDLRRKNTMLRSDLRPDKVVLKRKRSASAFQIFNPIQNPFTTLRERSRQKNFQNFFFQNRNFSKSKNFPKIIEILKKHRISSKSSDFLDFQIFSFFLILQWFFNDFSKKTKFRKK